MRVVVAQVDGVRVADELLIGEQVAHWRFPPQVDLVRAPDEQVLNVCGGQVELLVALQDSCSGRFQVRGVVPVHNVVIAPFVVGSAAVHWRQRLGTHVAILVQNVVLHSVVAVLVAHEPTSEVFGSTLPELVEKTFKTKLDSLKCALYFARNWTPFFSLLVIPAYVPSEL